MNIAISGGNGYIGQNLIRKLDSEKNTIYRIDRSDLYDTKALVNLMSGIDSVIHLAGSPILRRWTVQAKQEILSSRVTTTRNIVSAINQLPADKRPKTFISASAVGIYAADLIHTEKSSNFSNDFAGSVSRQWEAASEPIDRSVRRVIFRIGVVLGKVSATMKKMLPVFKSGLGGKIASGNQPFPFVHIDDVVGALYWASQNVEVSGIFNLVAPQNIDNKYFTNVLAKKLRRPALFAVPEMALKILYGEASGVLVKSPQVIPERLLEYGYRFKFQNIEIALDNILGQKSSQ